jgi:hypothetical protein
LIRGPSWELECFNKNVSTNRHALEKEVKGEHSKGIFISDVEKDMTSWVYHLGNEDFHRTLQKGSMKHSDFARLTPGRWLNDEVINGYIAMLDRIKIPDTLVLSTWFWPSMTLATKSAQNKVRVAKNMVSSHISKFIKINLLVYNPATTKKPQPPSKSCSPSVEVHLLPSQFWQ